ncbi:glycine--tRNA ligase [Haloferax volcanii]|uniref:glycine--tRNA ligase n=3 Tax=Haloferax volcanii TaxID=2246 RepID=D4GYP9_HALVD|nr:glycine--tRNA ligase [Haloferax volcanii]ADE04745.1 glycine--tRNA ligase [Haloferax volcanii DS2]ELY24267.1 glycyl-tRNA ligase [Haloferax volcanii DS2]MBS8118774.1 glycine--tRNA ligase [Haloferax volcanii]MBS8123788.1 glycine--tRNA ligase [Haloferax volcanii]MBS8127657.1 glycine--tRNA ligase [Haloferax volcanii]
MSEGDESAALTELAKRRGFFFGSSEAYGGVGGFYTYGPQGAALKSNVEEAWRERFAVQEGNLEIEAPTIMPEPVFEASGHLDGFDDMLVECAECGESHRADHLIEDNSELEDAETLSPEAAAEKIADLGLVCPTCGADLAGQSVEDFNLMFETNIGPGSSTPGYLRPETAQGIFVEFPRIKEYARNSLPFGVTQVGRAYRNEISPRKSIVRTREFTQAELEHFIDPERDEADLSAVEDVEVLLYPATEQEADDGDYVETTIGEAVDDGIIGNAWLGYFLGIAQEWYETVGVDMDRFRFRQHLAGERAHYSSDCWDAESEVDGDWIEIAGFSYRSDYDLSKHGEYGDDDFTVFQQYDEPKTVERAVVDPDMATLGPEFGAQAADVAEALETLAERDPDAFDADEVTLDVDGEEITVDTDVANFAVETQTEAGEHITPHVVEPSFGIDRTVYTLLAHAYETDEVDGEARSYLSLSPSVAPTNVGVFPLVSNVDGLVDLADDVAEELRAAGFAVVYDDSGSIGRRYRRQDEVGTPFCITIDRDGLEGDGADTVTIRERDSGKQVRLPVDDLVGTLVGLRAGTASFDDVLDDNEVVEA